MAILKYEMLSNGDRREYRDISSKERKSEERWVYWSEKQGDYYSPFKMGFALIGTIMSFVEIGKQHSTHKKKIALLNNYKIKYNCEEIDCSSFPDAESIQDEF